ERAIEQFRQAQQLTGPAERAYGLAAYDTAVALYNLRAYKAASDAFRRLLADGKGLCGFSSRSCALWYRQAGERAAYHAQRARMGIPEAERLDSQCGAASLAACLRSLSLPWLKPTVLANCRVTGMGSTAQDLLRAAAKLGAVGRAIAADDQALKLLPKPMVVHVERDHFVALVRADERGVSYLCTHCGCWPGGRVDLTWKQWHVMDPG